MIKGRRIHNNYDADYADGEEVFNEVQIRRRNCLHENSKFQCQQEEREIEKILRSLKHKSTNKFFMNESHVVVVKRKERNENFLSQIFQKIFSRRCKKKILSDSSSVACHLSSAAVGKNLIFSVPSCVSCDFHSAIHQTDNLENVEKIILTC